MAGPDLSIVIAAVDFSTILPALLSVFGAVVVAYLAWKGAKMVIAAVRGGSVCDGGDDGFSSDDEPWSQADYEAYQAERAEKLRAAGFGKFV